MKLSAYLYISIDTRPVSLGTVCLHIYMHVNISMNVFKQHPFPRLESFPCFHLFLFSFPPSFLSFSLSLLCSSLFYRQPASSPSLRFTFFTSFFFFILCISFFLSSSPFIRIYPCSPISFFFFCLSLFLSPSLSDTSSCDRLRRLMDES